MKRVDMFPAIAYLVEPGALADLSELSFTGPKPPRTRKVDRCRVAIVNGKLFIVQDSPEGPKVLFREACVQYSTSSNYREYTALTETGKMVAFGKDRNCGCGSRLRSWSPFGASAMSIEDPSE
jgi:hypothetical protein